MLPGFMSTSLTRRRYPTIMDHGATATDWDGDPTSITIWGSVQPGTGATDPINRGGAEVVYTVWAQPGQDVHDGDIIVYEGEDFFVNGEPERWRTGVLDHDVIRLSRWEERP